MFYRNYIQKFDCGDVVKSAILLANEMSRVFEILELGKKYCSYKFLAANVGCRKNFAVMLNIFYFSFT